MSKLKLILIISFCVIGFIASAQITGKVFTDINQDGIQNPTGTPFEPGKSGIIVNVYSAEGILLGIATTTSAGTYSMNYIRIRLTIMLL